MNGAHTIPIIELRGILIVSIQIDLSDQVVLELKEHIAEAIIRTRATGLVLEVSGMELMDSFITKAIGDVAKTARLMGVDTALAGLSPMIAMTLVEMGMEFGGVHHALNLADALEQLDEARRERRLGRDDPTDQVPVSPAVAAPSADWPERALPARLERTRSR